MRTLAVTLAFFSFFATGSFAENPGAFYIEQAVAHYFSLAQDAESLSMAGSNFGVCDTASCLSFNPAGLSKVTTWDTDFSLGKESRGGDSIPDEGNLRERSDNGSINTAFPIRVGGLELGTLAFGFSRYQGRVNDKYSTTPDGHRRTIGYGYAREDTALGYTFNFYDDQLRTDLSDLHSHARFLHIFALQHEFDGGFTLGGVFRLGIGQSDTEILSTHESGLSKLKEQSGSVFASKAWESFILSCAADLANLENKGNLTYANRDIAIGGNEEGTTYGFRIGGEFGVDDRLALRAGSRYYRVVNYRFERPDLSNLGGNIVGGGFSAGLGYRFGSNGGSWEKMSLNYGAEYFTPGHGGWTHLISFRVPFGG